MSKQRRQQALLELISEYEIDTQEELTRRLQALGFETTQATVSRDIRELKLEKVSYGMGSIVMLQVWNLIPEHMHPISM